MNAIVSRRARGLKRVLFLCPDNWSLSRFCEEYFNSVVRNEGLNWQAASRATATVPYRAPGQPPMDRAAVAALRELQAAPVNHERYPLPVGRRDISISDVVIALAVPALDSTSEWRTAPRTELWQPDSFLEPESAWRRLAGHTLNLISTLESNESATGREPIASDGRWLGIGTRSATPLAAGTEERA